MSVEGIVTAIEAAVEPGGVMARAKPLLIGDKWVQGAGEPLLSIDPATGEVNARVSAASARDVDEAIAGARAALRTSQWHLLLPHRRAQQLNRIADLIEKRAGALAEIAMHENGKTIRECTAQAMQAAGIFRYYASVCETLEAEVTPPRGDYLSLTTYEPHGIVAAITPWNSPINVAAEKLAPALAAGNAVILKPSEFTSIVSLQLGRLCIDAGLPPGLVNVLPGRADTGSALVAHPGVDMISFTGGTDAGRAIAKAAGERLVPALLELGGKSPNIVFADADIGLASAGVAAGIFGSLGQSCIAGSRLFVHESIKEDFVARIVARANSINLGPPDSKASELGPLASFSHRDRVHALVTKAVSRGAKVLAGARAPDQRELARGAYYLPTILDGVRNDWEICQTEIFGPVLCVLSFSNEEDLVTQANETIYGLACGIWSRDFQKAWSIARQIQAGNVWINTYRQNSVATAFGGYKQSGLGRERGPQGLRRYQQLKSIFVATGSEPLSLAR